MKNTRSLKIIFASAVCFLGGIKAQAQNTEEILGAVKINLTAKEYLNEDVCRGREKLLKDVIGTVPVDKVFEAKEEQEVQVQLFPTDMPERFFTDFKIDYKWGVNALVPRAGTNYEKKVADHIHSMFAGATLRSSPTATLKTKNQLLLCDLYLNNLIIQIKAVGHTTEEIVSNPFLTTTEVQMLSERLYGLKEYFYNLGKKTDKWDAAAVDYRTAKSVMVGFELDKILSTSYGRQRLLKFDYKHYSLLVDSLFSKDDELPALLDSEKSFQVSSQLVTKTKIEKPFEQTIEMKVRK